MHPPASLRLPPAPLVQFVGLWRIFNSLTNGSSFPSNHTPPHAYNLELCSYGRPAYNRMATFRRGGEFAAERAAVPQPSPRNSSYWTGISRKAGRIFARPCLPLRCPGMSQIASAGADYSKDSGDTREQPSNSNAVSLASVLHGQKSPLPGFLRLNCHSVEQIDAHAPEAAHRSLLPNSCVPDLCFTFLPSFVFQVNAWKP